MFQEFDMYEATFDGCRFGLTDRDGQPIKKPWGVVTTSPTLASELNEYKCSHQSGFKHSHAEGSKTKLTAFYPRAMCRTILNTLFREHVHKSIPSMAVLPVSAHAQTEVQPHREKDFAVQDFADIITITHSSWCSLTWIWYWCSCFMHRWCYPCSCHKTPIS